MISLQELEREPDKTYFNESQLTVAALLEGSFTSVFNHRMIPQGVDENQFTFLPTGKSSKLAIIASEDIIRNEVYGPPENPQYLPLGFDRYSNVQYGNREFVRNLVDSFIEDTDLIRLRAKTFQMQLLNKSKFYEDKIFYLLLNVLSPVLFILFLFLFQLKWRSLKYQKNN
jgi:ABC-2 type transport system permease protein